MKDFTTTSTPVPPGAGSCQLDLAHASEGEKSLPIYQESFLSTLGAGSQFCFMKKKILNFWGFVFCICIWYFSVQAWQLLRICFSQVAYLTAVVAFDSFLHLQIFQSVSPAQPFLQATGRDWRSECHLLPLAHVWTHAIHSSAGREEIVAIFAVVQCEILSASFFASPGKLNLLVEEKKGGEGWHTADFCDFFSPYRAAMGKDEADLCLLTPIILAGI